MTGIYEEYSLASKITAGLHIWGYLLLSSSKCLIPGQYKMTLKKQNRETRRVQNRSYLEVANLHEVVS